MLDIVAMEPQKNRKRNNSGNWIGIVIFLLVLLGPQIARVLSNLVSSISGGAVTLSPNLLIPLLILAVVIVSALITVGRAIGSRNQNRAGPGGSAGPMMRPPPNMSSGSSPYDAAKRASAPLPPRGLPRSAPPPWQQDRRSSDLRPGKLPGPPQFEPIIDPRVFAIGIAGLMVFGLIFAALFVLMGSTP